MPKQTHSLRFLLLQVRNPGDVMRRHEVESFARALDIAPDQISNFDLLAESMTLDRLKETDIVLLGGAGEYSAAGEGAWLERALDSLRVVHAAGQPTFASCWGFQAMARAMGGAVINEVSRAEVGTHDVTLTAAGAADPIFAPLAPSFPAQMGHEDHVIKLRPNTTLLATTDRVAHQAYRFDDAPIYCTQFHPELNRAGLIRRVEAYPEYIERIARVPMDVFLATLRESTAAEGILRRFVAMCYSQTKRSPRN